MLLLMRFGVPVLWKAIVQKNTCSILWCICKKYFGLKIHTKPGLNLATKFMAYECMQHFTHSTLFQFARRAILICILVAAYARCIYCAKHYNLPWYRALNIFNKTMPCIYLFAQNQPRSLYEIRIELYLLGILSL